VATLTSAAGMPPPGPPCALPPLSAPPPCPQAATERTSDSTAGCLKRMGIRADDCGTFILTFENPRNVALVMVSRPAECRPYNRRRALRSRRALPHGYPGHYKPRDRSRRHACETPAQALVAVACRPRGA